MLAKVKEKATVEKAKVKKSSSDGRGTRLVKILIDRKKLDERVNWIIQHGRSQTLIISVMDTSDEMVGNRRRNRKASR